MKKKLFKHQSQSLRFMANRERVFDFSDPGTGKTRVAIEDFGKRRAKGGKAALVLSPKTLLESAWGNDIAEFGNGLTCSLAYAENRAAAFNVDADMYITNIDAVRWLANQPKKFFDRFDTLYIDESTAYKHHTSQRSKAVRSIKSHFDIRRIMSGSPNPNGICDIWHQALLVDDGKRLGTSFYHFRSSVCTPVQTGPAANMVRWEDREGAEIAVTALLKDITIRHKFEDCTDIPRNHLFAVPFTLPPKLRAMYSKLEADSLLYLNEHKVSAINGGVLYNKLLQAASGSVYDENGKSVFLQNQRYELILDLVESRDKCVVFFMWEHQRNALITEAQKRNIPFALLDGSVTSNSERRDVVKHFQQGFYKVLFAHPQTAAHGLTLTAATTTIFASPTANAEHFNQAFRRIYRISQTKRTETIVVVAKDTRDESVFESYENKDLKMAKLLAEFQNKSR